MNNTIRQKGHACPCYPGLLLPVACSCAQRVTMPLSGVLLSDTVPNPTLVGARRRRLQRLTANWGYFPCGWSKSLRNSG